MGRFTILELTDAEARVLHVSRQKKKPLVVEFAQAINLADLPKDTDGAALRGARIKDALKQHKVPAAPCGILVPKQNSIVRTAVLPSADPEEIAEMALFETEKFIPFNAERHIVSNSVLHVDDVAGSQVLLAAVDSPIMENLLAITTATGLEPLVAEVTSVAIVRAFQTEHHQQPPAEHTATVLLHVGRAQTEISILDGTTLMASRSQSLGLDKLLKDLQEAMHLPEPIALAQLTSLDLANPDAFLLEGGVARQIEGLGDRTAVGDKVRDWQQRIVRFAKQTFEFAVREHGVAAASAVHLSGEIVLLTGAAQTLSRELGVPVQLFNPAASFARSPKAVIDEVVLSSMSAAAGTAIRLVEEEDEPSLRDNRINLLPLAVIEQQAASERKVLLMISGTMLIITMVLIYLAYDTQRAHSELLASRLREYNQDMRPIIEELDKKKEQLGIIRRITSNRAGAMEILDLLSTFPGMGTTTNNGVLVLNEFNYNNRDEVTIGGISMTFEDMQRFGNFLENLVLNDQLVFSDVGLPQPTPRSLGQNRPTVYFFRVTATLNTTNSGSGTSSRRASNNSDT